MSRNTICLKNLIIGKVKEVESNLLTKYNIKKKT